MDSPRVFKAKVCLIGEAAVGKTSLVRRYVEDAFDDRNVSTLGSTPVFGELAVEIVKRFATPLFV